MEIYNKPNMHYKNVADEIINNYFGGYIPNTLSEEGLKCDSEKEIYNLVEQIEFLTTDNFLFDEEFDDDECNKIHYYIIDLVKTHNI